VNKTVSTCVLTLVGFQNFGFVYHRVGAGAAGAGAGAAGAESKFLPGVGAA
jgi:hypothetical protein